MKYIFALTKAMMVFFAFTLSVTQPTSTNVEDDQNYNVLSSALKSGYGWISFSKAQACSPWDQTGQCSGGAYGNDESDGRFGYSNCEERAQDKYDRCLRQGNTEQECLAIYYEAAGGC